MTNRVKVSINNILSSEDGAILMAYIATRSGMFEPQKDANAIAVQQFMIGLFGELDLYTTRGDFPLRFVKSLKALPRSEGWIKDVKGSEE